MQKGSAEQLPAEYYPGPPQYPPPAGEYPPYPPAHQQLPYQPGPWQAPSQYPPPPNYQPHDPAAGGQQGEPAYSAYPLAQQAFLPDGRPDVEGAPPEYQSPMQESDGFSEKTIRRAFIKKVYLTLAVQLVITVGIICMFIYWKTLKNWVQYNSWFSYALFITSAIYLGCTVTPILFAIAIEPLINCAASYNLRALSPVIFILIIVLACCENARRKVPGNFILLGLFTIFEGLMLGAVSALFEADAVMWAVGATTFVTLGLSLFAFQTKWDFTMASGILWVVVLVLCAFGILCAIIRSFWLQIVYASIGTLVFAVYLVVDTQLMMGGKHKYSLSPEEYIFAALNLYLDIVNLFLFILQIIGLSR